MAFSDMVIRTQNSTQFTVLTWSSSFSGLIPFRMDLYMFDVTVCVCVCVRAILWPDRTARKKRHQTNDGLSLQMLYGALKHISMVESPN